MLSKDLIILNTPIFFYSFVREGERTINAYFPDARWYNYWTGQETGVKGDREELAAPWETINLHVKGGSILPIQVPDVTTMDSRTNGLGLLVALDEKSEAKGELYWDEGDSINPLENGKYTLLDFEVDIKY